MKLLKWFQPKVIFSKKNSIILSIIFSSLFLGFVSGVVATKTKIEDVSNYVANVVKNDAKGDLLSVTVEMFDGTRPPKAEGEFRKLYGVFRQERITFAAGYNLTKDETITVNEIDPTQNLSAVYIEDTTGSDEYKGHYKDKTFPVEFMFPLKRNDKISVRTMCVGKTQAEKILKSRGVVKDKYEEADYKTLVNTSIMVEAPGVFPPTKPDEDDKRVFLIQSVFYDDTYYIKDLYSTIGDFFTTSYYFPGTARMQNAYFMSSYEYENKYFMNYINETYKNQNCLFKCATDNGKNLKNEIDEAKVTSFYKMSSQTDFIEVLLITLASTLLIIAFFLLYSFFDTYNIQVFVSHLVTIFLPFLILFVINLFTGNVFWFSEIGTKVNAILSIIYAIGFFAFYIYKKYVPIVKKGKKKSYGEISV